MSYNLSYIQSLIDKCQWTLAKTYPTIPHEYIVKGRCSLTDEEFVCIVNAQRKHGIVERWYKYNLPYLHLGGYKYWTMGDPVEETTVINRQMEREGSKHYDIQEMLLDYIEIEDTVIGHVKCEREIEKEQSIKISRVARMLRAYLHIEDCDDCSVVYGFLHTDVKWLQESSISQDNMEELKRKLKQIAYRAITDDMFQKIHVDTTRLGCIRRLVDFLKESTNLLDNFCADSGSDVSESIVFHLTSNLFKPILLYNKSKLVDIIKLLLGSTFDRTFRKEELEAGQI